MLALIVDTYQFRGDAPAGSDALEAAAFIFNNRNAQIDDLATTSSLRARSVSEQAIAAGFAIADGATLDTVWLAAPDADALGFATASIENNLRLGLSVPVIIQFLRARRILDARLSEPLIAEAFRQVQIKRLPPPPKPPGPGGPGPGSSNVVLASLALAGIAAGVGVALVVRRRRRGGFLGAMAFRVPQDVADCKSQLKKIARNLKKAREERADAERQNYNIGVRVSDERISELTTAGRHFTEWLATHSLGGFLGLAGLTAQEMRGMGRAAARRIMEGLKPNSKAWVRRMKKQGLEHPLGWKYDHKRHPDLEWSPYVHGFWDEVGEMELPEGHAHQAPLTHAQLVEMRKMLMAMKAAEGDLDGHRRRYRRAA